MISSDVHIMPPLLLVNKGLALNRESFFYCSKADLYITLYIIATDGQKQGGYLLCESKFLLYITYGIICRASQCTEVGSYQDNRRGRNVLSLFCFGVVIETER